MTHGIKLLQGPKRFLGLAHLIGFSKTVSEVRAMAQSGSASVWGTGGRRFESC